jgi:spore coat polysaccharide biosynthesis protein SpsF (cytidylyltransferase family)
LKACAVVQARVNSTRLPGKVLMDLAGRPMIARVAARARRIPGIAELIVATPDGPADAELRRTVSTLEGVTLFSGSENDVLDRYYQAAKKCQADVVLRATADCPFIDPEVAGRVLKALLDKRADFAANNEPLTFPHGLDVEAFTFAALEAAWREAKEPSQREHVSPFIRRNRSRFKAAFVKHDKDIHALRWTVDEAADLEFARAVAGRLGGRADEAGFQEIVDLLEREPNLTRINAGIRSAHL